MIVLKPAYRAPLLGTATAALLVGSFLLGTAQASPATAAAGATGATGAARMVAATGGKVTVTGTGTVTGTPNQLTLSMGVHVSSSSVSSALSQASRATRRVVAALRARGVRAADIATSGLSVQPDYRNGSPDPAGYQVSEQVTATLWDLGAAGRQIQAAVTAGGNATVVDGVSLNLTDTGTLLAQARAAAVRDARARAAQFARALGQPLGGVISISDQTAQYGPALPAFANDKAAASPVPISPGTQQVSVQITVVYAIG